MSQTEPKPADPAYTEEEPIGRKHESAQVTISGKAVDSAGKGIDGLEIHVHFIDSQQRRMEGRYDPLKTDVGGEFQLTQKNIPPGAKTACLTYPKRHTLPDSRAVALRGPELVEVPLRTSYRLRDRVYETVGCAIQGSIVREVVRDGRTNREPFPQVPVDLIDTSGTGRGSVTSDVDGTFCFSPTLSKLEEFTLRFQPRLLIGADAWLTKTNEITIVVDPGFPGSPCEPVLYALDAAQIEGNVMAAGRGLGGVQVTLVWDASGARTTINTDDTGEYRFTKLSPGAVRLLFENRFTDRNNASWELTPSQPEQVFNLRAGDRRRAVTVHYVPEEHTIEWFVRGADGKGLSGYLVELRGVDGKSLLRQEYSDMTGRVRFSGLTPGNYKVYVYADERTTVPPLTHDVVCNSVFTGSTVIPARARPPGNAQNPSADGNGNGGNGNGGNGNGVIRESVADLAAYPVLTEQVNVAGSGGTATPVSAPPCGGGSGSLARLVSGTLRDVLGWKPPADDTGSIDTRAFVSALSQSFAGKEVEGRTEYSWVPRSAGALARPADLGAVTGAQLSIYTRARAALDQAGPLLDGLYPLRPDIVPEDVEAIRAVVRAELGQVVDELGTVGGPRVARVDELFNLLLLDDPAKPNTDSSQPCFPDPENVQGQLKELRERLGLERTRVNTIADEQNYTNFLILVDYVNTLNQSWLTERKYFTRDPDPNAAEPYLGTQLVLLAQDLAAAAEAVQDVKFTLESVFLGPSIQQTLKLTFTHPEYLTGVPGVPGDEQPAVLPNDTPSMFVSELLGWADVWLTREARDLIDSSGKDGVIAIFPTANLLRKLVRAALIQSGGGEQDPATLPPGYKSPRVQRAILELANQLDDVARTAGQIVVQEKAPRADVTAQSLLEALQDPNVVAAIKAALRSNGSLK
jgi:hypothetical protein